MHFSLLLALIAGAAVLLGLVSVRLRSTSVSVPLAALAMGAIAGPSGMNVVRAGVVAHSSEVRWSLRLVLAVTLMAAAVRSPLRDLRRSARTVTVLLAVVLPAGAAVGAALAVVIGGLPVTVGIVVGAALAPTDPVLAAGTVSGPRARRCLPGRLRRLLVLESGLNDGLALPLVLLGLSLAGQAPWKGAIGSWAGRAAYQVAVAVVLGAALGAVVGAALRHQARHRRVERPVVVTLPVALAFLVVAVCRLAGSDGLLGVFVAGLVFRGVYRDAAAIAAGRDAADGMSRLLVPVVFFGLGVLAPWGTIGQIGVVGTAVAILLLRRLPIVLLLRNVLRLTAPQAMFVGWFGPPGASALYYWGLASARGRLTHQASTLLLAVITLSVVAYALSGPLGTRASARLRDPGHPDRSERPTHEARRDARQTPAFQGLPARPPPSTVRALPLPPRA